MDFKAGGTLEKRDLSASSTGRITTPIASRFAVSSATSTLLNHDRSGLVAHRGEESCQFVACKQSLFESRNTRHPAL